MSPPTKPTASLKQKLREKIAHMRKTPLVTPEQKLLLKLESLKIDARALNSTVTHLLAQAATFTSRAANTPVPSAPPAAREALFERPPLGGGGGGGVANSYDVQVSAYRRLVQEWRGFEKAVGEFERRLEGFEKTLGSFRERHFEPERAVGKVEHEFIGLDNALVYLEARKGELERVVAGVEIGGEV